MHIKKSILLILLVCLMAGLGGCAFGRKVGYQNVQADIDVSGNKRVVVATWDQRPYVVSGGKSPTFVGLSRGGYGNPFNVNTESGKPLSDDFTKSIAGALSARGFVTSEVATTPTSSRRAINDAIGAEKAERAVLITLKEWKSDTFFNTNLIYDVTVRVSDGAGEEIASAKYEGKDDIGKGAIVEAFRRKVEEWFSDPKIKKALE